MTTHINRLSILPKVGGVVGGCTVINFFCDLMIFGLPQKILLLWSSRSGRMLLTGGRGDPSGKLLLVASLY